MNIGSSYIILHSTESMVLGCSSPIVGSFGDLFGANGYGMLWDVMANVSQK